MPSNNDLDPYAILATLGINHPDSVSAVTGGADTALWRVRHANKTYALRVFRREQRTQYQAEQAAMTLAAEAHLPVPHIVASGLWRDYPALLLSWCPGQTVRLQLKAQPWRVWSTGIIFGRMQARIHAVRMPPHRLQQADDWIAWAGGEDTELHQKLRVLARGSASLLHMDYHLHNVLVDGNQVSGIIDWANAQIGDPRAGFARTYTILRVEPWTPKPSLSLTLLRWILAEAWRRGYQEIAGVPQEMPLFYVWAGQAMVADLAHRVQQPASWFQDRHLAAIQAWTDQWSARAGLSM